MNWMIFLQVLIAIESGGDINAHGDKHLTNQAYGICQIRQPYLTDVNLIAGTSFTLKEVADSQALSRWATITYIRHYGARYTRITGKPLTYEVAARIHNGGPNGWKKESTDAHWAKFQAAKTRMGL